MIDDIVDRLRDRAAYAASFGWDNAVFKQAADRIELLETALRAVRTHCEYDYPPNAKAIIMFVNTALEKIHD